MSAANRAAPAAATSALRDPARWPAALTRLAASAVAIHLEAIGRLGGAPQIVGFHGQTVSHRPSEGFTLQLGDGAAVAAGCGVATVWDFRSEDMRAGGEGAPLAPFFHFALARRAGMQAPAAFLNLGGVGNVTWIDPSVAAPQMPGALLAFDTGPANALIDDFMAVRTSAASTPSIEVPLIRPSDQTGLPWLTSTIPFPSLPRQFRYRTRPPPYGDDR
jgi:1,6-anhydro-N-acetylmuramate kinase